MKKEGQHKHFNNRLIKIAWLSISVLIILSLLILPGGSAQAQEEIEVPEGTVPSIDGLISPGEWDDALKVEGTPPWHMIYLKHGEKLYIAVEAIGDIDEFYLAFDTNGDGEFFDAGDDIIRCLKDAFELWVYIDKYVFERDPQQDVDGARTYDEEADISTYELSILDVWFTPIFPGIVVGDVEYPFDALIYSILVPMPPMPPPLFPPLIPLSDEYFKFWYGIDLKKGDKDWSPEERKMMDDVLKILPESFLRQATLKTIRRDQQLPSEPGVAGTYNRKDTIRIFDAAWLLDVKFNGKDKKKEFLRTIIHELTHHRQYEWPRYVDPKMNPKYKNAFDNPWMQSYMKATKWEYNRSAKKWKYKGNEADLPTKYAKTNAKDDMSESAVFYILAPKVLKDKSLTRYNWLKTNLFKGREYVDGKGKK